MGKYRDQFEELIRKLLHGKDQEDFLEFVETFDRRDDLYHTLKDDVLAANKALKTEPQNQFLRRTVVRTSFSMIEGMLNILNQTVLETHKRGYIQLTEDEIEFLTEQTKTKKRGLRQKFWALGNKVQFSFSIFARKMGGFDYSIDITTTDWKNFESAIQIRNQLMHPRKLVDLMLDHKQVMLILGSTKWFLTLHSDLERHVGEASIKHFLESLIKARIEGIQQSI